MEWIVIRALAVIFIGALEGIAAYTPEGTQRTVEEQVAEMERKTALAQASARMNAARGAAFIKAAKGVAKAAFTKEDEAEDEEEETPEEAEAPENVVQMPVRNGRSKGGKRKKTEEEVKATVYRLLEGPPTMSLNEIAHRGKVSISSASKYKNQWEAENGVERDARGRLKRTRAG